VPKLFGKRKTLAWTDIDKLEVKSGFVKIKAKDRRRAWTTSPIESVPNVTTLASLIHAAPSPTSR
jgi:hypothetical protein